MQNKSLLYGVVAVVILALGVGFFVFAGKNSPESEQVPSQTSPTTQQTQTSQTQNTTLKELLSKGGSNTCTFTNSTANSQSSGTVYTASGMMRGDFTTVAAGKTIESHMIVKDGTSYMWSSSMPSGVKMSFASVTKPAGEQQSSATVDPNASMDYSCTPWSADSAKFTLPIGVTFQDLSAMMPTTNTSATAGAGVSASSVQCGACDAIPDAAAKAQCKVALKCK